MPHEKMDFHKLATTKVLMGYAKDLKKKGYEVIHDKDAGTLTIKDDNVTVLRAIQKGKNQPWIAGFKDSVNVKWNCPRPPALEMK